MAEFEGPKQSDLEDENSFVQYAISQTTTKGGPLRTTASVDMDPQYAATSYNISDLLQGSLAVQDPSDILMVANKGLTKTLNNIYESNPEKQLALLSSNSENLSASESAENIYGQSGFNVDNSINQQWVASLPTTVSFQAEGSQEEKEIMLWARTGFASEAMHLPVADSIEEDIKKHIQSNDLNQTRKHPYFMDRDAQDTRSSSAPFAGADGYVYNWEYGENIVSTSTQKTFGNEDPNRPGKKGSFGLLDPLSEQWYVSMSWPSEANSGQWSTIGLPAIDDAIKSKGLTLSKYKGCRILVYHPKSGKAVVATPGDLGPAPDKLRYSAANPDECNLLGLSPDISSYFGVSNMTDKVMVGFVDKTWTLGPYSQKINNLDTPDPGYTPNVPGSTNTDPITVAPGDWSVGAGSKNLVDSLDDIKHAMSMLRDHPNMWATKKQVWGTRNGHGPIKPDAYYGFFGNGFPDSSPDAAIKVPNSARAFIFPSLINFLWICCESGWIFDGCAGAVGKQSKPGPADGITVHEIGAAIDFMFLGHVDMGGTFPWRMEWSTMPTRGPKGGPSNYKESQFRGAPVNNPKYMHWYTKYSELVNKLAQFISSLPKDKRPSSLGAPFAVPNSVIHQDWKPNHMHIDFMSFRKVKNQVILTDRIGKLLPQLKP